MALPGRDARAGSRARGQHRPRCSLRLSEETRGEFLETLTSSQWPLSGSQWVSLPVGVRGRNTDHRPLIAKTWVPPSLGRSFPGRVLPWEGPFLAPPSLAPPSLGTSFPGHLFPWRLLPWEDPSLAPPSLGTSFPGQVLPWHLLPWRLLPWGVVSEVRASQPLGPVTPFLLPDPDQYSWGENYAGSSGLMSSSPELGPTEGAKSGTVSGGLPVWV